MTNHHGPGIRSQIAETLRVWYWRRKDRIELAKFSERDLHDVGLSWSEMIYEAEKPFWRS